MTSKQNLENSICIHVDEIETFNKSKAYIKKVLLLLETFEKLFPIDILILLCIQLREIFLWDQFLSDNKTSSAYIKLLILVVTSGRMFRPDKSQPFPCTFEYIKKYVCFICFIVQLKLELLI